MSLRKDSRQIPKAREICSNKKYFDILYAYLQCISDFDKDTCIRTFPKKDINFSKLGELFGVSRQTISVKFKNLKELGLIKDYNKDFYELITLENDLAALVQYDTLKLITDTLSDNAISTYVFLLNQFYKAQVKGKVCQFTLEQVKTHIGICATTRSNDNIITNILFVLQKIGLIEYHLTGMSQEADSFANIKTIYQLDNLVNDIKDIKC